MTSGRARVDDRRMRASTRTLRFAVSTALVALGGGCTSKNDGPGSNVGEVRDPAKAKTPDAKPPEPEEDHVNVGPTDDPATLKLASRENKGSGYSMSDYKKILEKIYIDARRDESRSLARTVQSRLFSALKAANPQLENRGIKTAPFAVLIGTQMPAILVEVACISNEEEAELLTKDSYRESIAVALAAGIRNYANPPETVARKGT